MFIWNFEIHWRCTYLKHIYIVFVWHLLALHLLSAAQGSTSGSFSRLGEALKVCHRQRYLIFEKIFAAFTSERSSIGKNVGISTHSNAPVNESRFELIFIVRWFACCARPFVPVTWKSMKIKERQTASTVTLVSLSFVWRHLHVKLKLPTHWLRFVCFRPICGLSPSFVAAWHNVILERPFILPVRPNGNPISVADDEHDNKNYANVLLKPVTEAGFTNSEILLFFERSTNASAFLKSFRDADWTARSRTTGWMQVGWTKIVFHVSKAKFYCVVTRDGGWLRNYFNDQAQALYERFWYQERTIQDAAYGMLPTGCCGVGRSLRLLLVTMRVLTLRKGWESLL